MKTNSILFVVTLAALFSLGVILYRQQTKPASTDFVELNVEALAQTEDIKVLNLCIECRPAVCVYQYEYHGEIITEEPIYDFIRTDLLQ